MQPDGIVREIHGSNHEELGAVTTILADGQSPTSVEHNRLAA